MADFSGLGALDAAAWPVLDELTASTGENAASGIPTGGQAAAAMELDVGRLAADGDGPSSDWLEQLSQGVEEWDNAMKSKAKLKALDDLSRQLWRRSKFEGRRGARAVIPDGRVAVCQGPGQGR